MEDAPRDDGVRPHITTEEEFRQVLRNLVIEADSNGVDVRGGWPIARGDETGMWSIEITALSHQTTAHVDDTGSPAVSIVEAVAARDGVETTDLPPLQDAIDHEILETLLAAADDEPQQHVRFQYHGYEVTVRSDGAIRLDG